jgi:hypothetical protein
MAKPKTTFTDVPVSDHLAKVEDPRQRVDCEVLVDLMRRVTGCEPVMYGPSIVGFDRYRYRYASGHEGEAPVVGFACARRQITLYLVLETEAARALLARLGRHSTGKVCLYVKRLADVELPVLEELVTLSVAEVRGRYPTG